MRAALLGLFGWLIVAMPAPAAPPAAWERTFAELLAVYVRPDGVRYAAWRGNPGDIARLVEVCDAIGRARLPAGDPDRIAFYINAYNAWVLRQVVTAPRLAGVRELAPEFGFFTRPTIRVAGEVGSLDHLEKGILLREYPDLRIHFAINCASRSCPPLLAAPYRADQIEAQLDAAAAGFINDPVRGVALAPGGVRVSKIFEWYRPEFESAGGITTFINRFRREPLPVGTAIGFLEYDWSLNDAGAPVADGQAAPAEASGKRIEKSEPNPTPGS